MKLPRKKDLAGEWIIGDAVWSVAFTKVIKYGKDNKGIVGLTDYSNNSIQIKTNQSKVETLSTFVHEILHAMDEEHKLKLTHEQIYGLEEAIMNFLASNF